MRFFVSSALLVTSAVLIGCDRPAPKTPEKSGIEIQAPGVDVKVGGGEVEVKAPGVDVNTSRDKGTDVQVETAPPE